MNKSEKIVNEICQNSFLSFWSFPNPIREDNKKELTDVLIVNNPYVIIISVKDIKIKRSGDIVIDKKRWYKRAIKKSYNQIYGTERIIKSKITGIYTSDKKHRIHFPEIDKIKVIRIGISIGRKGDFALPFGHFETGFVHFFDQYSFPIILNELDTITDFVQYIELKEDYFDSGNNALFRSEEDLLAIHLHRGRKLSKNYDKILVEPFVWDKFVQKEEYKKRRQQERISYIWDKIIQEFFRDFSKEQLIFNNKYIEIEQSLRAMSKETRFERMMLSDSFLHFIGYFNQPKACARISPSSSGVTYVFLLDDHREDDRKQRIQELQLRCLAARNVIQSNKEVVGITTNPYINGGGHSYDLCYLNISELSEDKRQEISRMQKELGYFVNPDQQMKHYDEYPK